ncbi:MAG: hypothetical protein K8R92_10675 [Planctomycetes bacterium]|nr:hypothetical protein [Planctomycetota bacterium]
MFRLSSSFAVFVLVVLFAVSSQQASGIGASASTTTVSKSPTTSSTTSSSKGIDLVSPADQASKRPSIGTTSDQSSTETDSDLKPRVLADKSRTTGPNSMDAVLSQGGPNRGIRSGRIVVKFLDELKVRCNPNSAGGKLTTASMRAPKKPNGVIGQETQISEALALVDRFGGKVEQAIHKTTAQLSALEQRAAARTGTKQPDLAGYIFLTVDPSALTAAAEAFNDLDCVEFAQVDYLPIPAQSGCPDKDLSLQKGISSEGADIGINCQTITDSGGATIACTPPGPIFVFGDATVFPPVALSFIAFSASGGAGAISCNRPSRWAGYNPVILSDPACTSYTPAASTPLTWDCTPNCNLGSGTAGRCVNPPTGFTSTSDCQYGCRDNACATYLTTTLGFTLCADQTQANGWDATCATLANIYCPQLNASTPYNGITVGPGMQQTDLASMFCFVTNPALPPSSSTYAFDDSVSYDACFTLRGPAAPGFVGTAGILKYTDIGTGDGIRPWGFSGAASLFPYPFLTVGAPAVAYPTPSCDAISAATATQFMEGGVINPLNPGDSANAALAEYDNAFKSAPFTFSHDCFTVADSIPGCYTTPCCVFVCVNDPSCCAFGWDASCVATANTNPALCQSGAINTLAWAPPPPAPGVPSFDAVPVGAGPVFFRARNLGLFRTRLPNVVTTSEYVGQIQAIATASLTTATPGIVPLSAITAQSNAASIPLGLDETYAFINSGFSGGGIDVQGMVDFSTGIGFGGTSVLGNLTQVGVIDYSAIVDHVDLLGQVTVEPGQTIVVPAAGTSSLIDPDHGTAILGILVAADNGFGITGLLPLSQAIFFPAVTLAQGGRVATAMVSAGETLVDGDVLCIPLEYGAGFTLASDTFISQLFGVVDGLGTTIVIPAGNGGFSVQTPTTPPIAITVGSCWPGLQTPVPYGANNNLLTPNSVPYPGNGYCRYRSSNWSENIGNGGVDCAGWGVGICTLGAGTLFNDGTRLQTYQANFGATSGACAMIAGLIGALNGFSEEAFGGSIGTPRIRNILNNVATDSQGNPTGGFLGSVNTQCLYPQGQDLPSTIVDIPAVVANGDILPAGQGTNHNVGGFPKAQTCLSLVLANESYPGGTPYAIEVITGTNVIGNKFSVGTLNNKFLQIQAQQKGRGSRGSGYGPPVQYVSMGLATDVQVRSVLQVASNDLVNDVLFQGYGMVTGGGASQALGIVYAYNRQANRWVYLNFGFLNGAVPAQGAPNVSGALSATGYNAQDFIVTQGAERVVYARFLTFGFGVVGPYKAFWDQLFIQMNPPIIFP